MSFATKTGILDAVYRPFYNQIRSHKTYGFELGDNSKAFNSSCNLALPGCESCWNRKYKNSVAVNMKLEKLIGGKMNLKCVGILFLVIITTNLYSQEQTGLSDKIFIDKFFISGVLYSFDGENYIKASYPLTGTYTDRFKSLFLQEGLESQYFSKSVKKQKASSLFGMFAGGLIGFAWANSLSDDPLLDNSTSKYFYISAAVLLTASFTFDASSYKDLGVAVKIRNDRYNN